MAVRTVSVTLKMQITDFELAAAKAAAITKALGDDFEGLGKKTKGAGDEFEGLGKKTTKPTKAIQDFSRVLDGAMKDGKTAFESISQSIDDTKSHITKLKEELRTSQSSSKSSSLFGDLKSAKNDLRILENAFKEIAPVAEKAGQDAAKSFTSSFSSIGAFITSPLGIGAIVAALPVITAAVSAAIAAGVGLGVIAAGAFILKSNAQVKAAFAPLKDDLRNVFQSAALPMVQPIIEALASIDVWVKKEQPAFTALFASVAPSVSLVTKGIEGFISTLIPALTRVGDVFTKTLQDPSVKGSLRDVSDGFANIFNSIANHPQEVADGFIILNKILSFTEGLISGLVNVVGPLVADLRQLRAVTDEYGQSIDDAAKKQLAAQKASGDTAVHYVRVSMAAEDAAKASGNFADNSKQAADMVAAAGAAAALAGPNLKALQSTLSATALTADTLAGAMTDKLVGGMLAADMANNTFNKSLVTVGDTIVALGGNLTQHVKALKKTETGQQQETDAVFAAIQANLQVYDSQIAVGISAEDAARAYDKNAASLDAQVKSAGHVPPAVQKLIDKYAKVPDKVNTIIAVQGLTAAIDNLNATLLLLSHIDGFAAKASVTTTYYTKGKPHTGPLSQSFNRWGGVYEPADMGLVRADVYTPKGPARYAFAEPQTGGEAFIPKHGDYGRSMGIITAAAGWYGARVVEGSRGGGGAGVTEFRAAPGDQVAEVLLSLLRPTVRGRYRGSAQLAVGSG